MKRSLSLIISGILLVSAVPFSQAEVFGDVDGTVYATAIHALAGSQVLRGYPDGSFYPTALLNRAEAVRVLVAARGAYDSEVNANASRPPPLPLFSDVDQYSWYNPSLEVAFRHGIITGYDDGSFQPGGTVTVAEAIVMVARAFDENGQAAAYQTSTFLQNQPGQWFTPYVNVMLSKNLIMRSEPLSPDQPIMRGQFFDIVYRMRDMKGRGLTAFSGSEPQATVGQPAIVQQYVPSSSDIPASPPPASADVPQVSADQSDAMKAFASKKPFAISLPTLGINDLTISHPKDPFTSKGVLSVLGYGVGHLFAYPGQGGKIMVYGHSSDYPWHRTPYSEIFRKINKAQVGDFVYVTYGKKLYVYQVTYKNTVPAKDRNFIKPDGKEELVLYTCWPPDNIILRYLVHAKPVGVIDL